MSRTRLFFITVFVLMSMAAAPWALAQDNCVDSLSPSTSDVYAYNAIKGQVTIYAVSSCSYTPKSSAAWLKPCAK